MLPGRVAFFICPNCIFKTVETNHIGLSAILRFDKGEINFMPDGRCPNRLPYKQSLFMYLYGEEVRQLKTWLIELNDEYRFSSKQLDDSSDYFGFDTLHCVRNFQKFVGLSPTGTYDLKTHEALEWKFYDIFKSLGANPAGLKSSPQGINSRKW